VVEAGDAGSPHPTGAALHQAQGTAPKRLKANSRSLQRLMLRRREPNRSYHENPNASLQWVKVKNPKARAVTREAEEDWGK
jgi:hypothetical protein